MLLAEGSSEATLYVELAKKLLRASKATFNELSISVRDALRPMRKRLAIYKLCGKVILVVLKCGGYENLKHYIKIMLESPSLVDAIDEGLRRLIIAADRDRSPVTSLYNVISSMGLKVALQGNIITINVSNGRSLMLEVVEQGVDEETRQLEDDLKSLVQQVWPIINEVIEKVKSAMGALNSKQTIGIYEAIAVNNEGLPSLIAQAIDKANIDELKAKLPKQIRVMEDLMEICKA